LVGSGRQTAAGSCPTCRPIESPLAARRVLAGTFVLRGWWRSLERLRADDPPSCDPVDLDRHPALLVSGSPRLDVRLAQRRMGGVDGVGDIFTVTLDEDTPP